MNRVMILKGGSPAIHKLGDIGRPEDDYIRVHSETDTHYIGNFEEGYGFIDVQFNKEDCRPLTDNEVKEMNGKWYSINGNPLYKIYLDKDGNVITGKCTMLKGTIIRVLDNDGFSKHSEFVDLKVSFAEDIEIGRSVVLMTGEGTIQTSKVVSVDIKGNDYYLQTKNSLYVIQLSK
jgi:hypothetical protein